MCCIGEAGNSSIQAFSMKKKMFCQVPRNNIQTVNLYHTVVAHAGSTVIQAGNGKKNDIPDVYISTIPIGLQKLEKYGIQNAIIEIDLNDGVYNFHPDNFPTEGFCRLLETRIKWCHEHLHPESKVFCNIRDLSEIMPKAPERVFEVVGFLAKLPAKIRPLGMMFEEPTGKTQPEECGAWSRFIRRVMDGNKWKGHLLVHIHERYGFSEASVMQVRSDLS